MVSFPLPVSTYIAPGADPADAGSYQYTDISADVRYDPGITIQVGQQDEGSKVDTTAHNITLDNRSGNYSRRNPLGAWYGVLRSGTPVQTRVMLIDDLFHRVSASGLGLDTVSGQAWDVNALYSANGTVGLATLASANTAITSVLNGVCADDVDMLKVTSISAVATGAAWVDATIVRYQDLNNFLRVHTEFGTGGVISVKVVRTDGGTAVNLLGTTSTSVTYSAGTKIRTRIQAIGPSVRVKVWLDGSAEPVGWINANDSTRTTVRGNAVGLYEWRVVGNTNAGTMVASIYEFRVDAIRASTPVPEWSPRWGDVAADATTPIQGAGIIRRLSQGQAVLRSPMYRQISSLSTLLGYWPCEDGGDATSVANIVPLGNPATITNMQLGSDGPEGSAGAATFTNPDVSSRINGAFRPASTTAGWQVSWSSKMTTLPSTLTQLVSWTTSDGNVWAVDLNTGVYDIVVNDSTGANLVNFTTPFAGTGPPNQWITFRMKATVSSGTVTWEFAWFAQGAANTWGISGTFSGTVGALRTWTANGNITTGGGSICHVYGVTTGSNDLLSFAATRAFDGYAGETAGNRLIRLGGEEDVPVHIMGDPDATAAMGPQTTSTFLDLARECEDADQGVLHERGAGLGFLARMFRYNVPVSIALDFAAGHVAAPPEPTDDDQNLINTVTVTRTAGSSVTVADSLSVGLSGSYSTDVTANVAADEQLADQAGWRLHLGTLAELRWPSISLQLHRNPSLIPAWCGMRLGSRITIANPPSQVAGSLLDLIVIGWTETISLFSWDVTLNCAPATAWDIGIYDDAATRRDSGSTFLGVARDAVQTSWTFSTNNPAETWSTSAGDYPLDMNCAGERITVTTMGSVSGTGPYSQTATVTRSVNAISKPQLAFSQISLWRPVLRGL